MIARQVIFALAHPVFDPVKQMRMGHSWLYDRHTSAMLTVNIGLE